MEVSILGTVYKIFKRSKEQDSKLEECDGYCDYSTKNIVVITKREKDKMDLDNLKVIDNRILRHEIIHAFVYESGLWCNSFGVSSWAQNEEMTDWIALQFPKIYEVFKKLNILL